MTSLVTYTDPLITYDPAVAYPEYASNGDYMTCACITPESLRPLVQPLTLPDVISVMFVHHKRETWVPLTISADLDAEANHGWTTVHFHADRYEDKGFSLQVSRPGHPYATSLHACPKCPDPWAVTKQESWGNATRCGACGYYFYYSIGD